MVGVELVVLRFAAAGGILQLAFANQPVFLQHAQVLRDGGQAQAQFAFQFLLGDVAVPV